MTQVAIAMHADLQWSQLYAALPDTTLLKQLLMHLETLNTEVLLVLTLEPEMVPEFFLNYQTVS
jgi:hypothetical protein